MLTLQLKKLKFFVMSERELLVVLYGHFTPRSGLGGLGAYGLGGLGA